MSTEIDWEKNNICFIANENIEIPEKIDDFGDSNKDNTTDIVEDKQNERIKLRKKIEPWLTAIFQSEHLSLLLGTGVTTALCNMIQTKDSLAFQTQTMNRMEFSNRFSFINAYADENAKNLDRGKANIEDDIRVTNELLKGLLIQDNKTEADALEQELNELLKKFATGVLQNESNVLAASNRDKIIGLLRQFLISFASRTATRDRLHIFTTNYDRFIEYALDDAGIYIIDRFVGKIKPTMRMNKLEIDYHFNPPGIRGEPRYMEGVVRYTKLHGSFDWQEENGNIVKIPLPFGFPHDFQKPHDTLIIYPNSSKGIETVYFPYSELFRDFSSAVCRSNSVLVTYGYGFGDSHINRIIEDMMRILSTHVVIISYDIADGRVKKFVEKCNKSQITLLIGKELGNLENLVNWYLPKSAIDKISDREIEIIEKRSSKNDSGSDF